MPKKVRFIGGPSNGKSMVTAELYSSIYLAGGNDLESARSDCPGHILQKMLSPETEYVFSHVEYIYKLRKK